MFCGMVHIGYFSLNIFGRSIITNRLCDKEMATPPFNSFFHFLTAILIRIMTILMRIHE